MNDSSKPLANARHEAFAQWAAKGHSDCEAYTKAGYKGNPEKCAYEIRGNPGVSERVAWLQTQAAKATVLTVQRKREILHGIAEDGERDSDRIKAIEADNDLAGDGAEARAQSSLSDLVLRFAQIRSRKKVS